MSVIEKLATIQQALKAPKDQRNDFAKFNYRSCEGILEALKPLLGNLTLIISDEMVLVGDRVYVKATVSISDGENMVEATAFAREPLVKKGMDEAQITGATSSYARKYALNGMFLIDDNKDPDSVDNSDHVQLTEDDIGWIDAVKLDAVVLEQIVDLDYRQFIKNEVAK